MSISGIRPAGRGRYMLLITIALATMAAGLGSVWLASLLVRLGDSSAVEGGDSHHLLSLAAGALLATAFLHLLPEAFESGEPPARLFAALLCGLVAFFLLDKAELWHQTHDHVPSATLPAAQNEPEFGHDGDRIRHSANGEAALPSSSRTGGWAVLLGDCVHCFSDGLLIATAFIADVRLGLAAALAVLVHEIPHHIGDIVLLRQAGGGPRPAARKVAIAGSVTTIGGVAGLWLVHQLSAWMPYFLVFAGSSFAYVALADLVPQLRRHLRLGQIALQVAWMVCGVLSVGMVSSLAEPARRDLPNSPEYSLLSAQAKK